MLVIIMQAGLIHVEERSWSSLVVMQLVVTDNHIDRLWWKDSYSLSPFRSWKIKVHRWFRPKSRRCCFRSRLGFLEVTQRLGLLYSTTCNQIEHMKTLVYFNPAIKQHEDWFKATAAWQKIALFIDWRRPEWKSWGSEYFCKNENQKSQLK